MRPLVTVVALGSFLLSVVSTATAASRLPGPLASLQSTFRTMSNRASWRVAMEVKDLATGYTSGVNMNAVMPAASTIKIPVMVEVFHQMAQGRFDLNRRVELLESDRDWGSGEIADDPVGTTFPVSQLLTDMITVSDNTAANMLIRLVGRRNINATMARLGLRHTKLSDYIRTDEWRIRSTLRTTPADMIALLTRMARAQLVNQWCSREMIAILEQQEINTLLPEPLPDIPIAHKTGSLDDTLNDVGIVFGTEPYAIAVMTTNLPTLSSGRQFIRRVSKLAYNNLERFATWRTTTAAPIAVHAAWPTFTPSPAAASTADLDDIPFWAPQTPLPATPLPAEALLATPAPAIPLPATPTPQP